ncbi:MAG: T9SS type A sorting domain-containing protein [Chitinophagaceae bacterium]
MKRLWLCCAGIVVANFLYAQIDGPFNGTVFTTGTLTGSSSSWTNAGNVAASDNTYANFPNLPNTVGAHTDFLIVTGFGFNLPVGATINGIVVEIERSDVNFRTSDYAIDIVKGGVVSTTNRASNAAYSFSDSYQSFGAPGDFWGETWTYSDINDPGFGIAIAAQRNSTGGTTGGKIDNVRITVFYDFILTPLRLISFTGSKKNNAVQLAWTTEVETDMDRYEIQRSADGLHYTTIGTVKSLNEMARTTYNFTDQQPLNGISYYRLRMVGYAQNDIGFSRIITIGNVNGDELNLFPNPLRYGDNLSISNSSAEQLNIQFYNISGQQLGTIITNSTTVNTSTIALSKGILLYRIADKNLKLIKTGKLIVQ